MGHITDQYGPYYSPTPYPSPREGGRKVSLVRLIRPISPIRLISPITPSSPLWGD